jgi:hypothetical protein
MSSDEVAQRILGRDPMRRSRSQKRAVQEARADVIDTVEILGLWVNGATALGDHIIERIADSEEKRRERVGSDRVLNLITAKVMGKTIDQVTEIQGMLVPDEFNLRGGS